MAREAQNGTGDYASDPAAPAGRRRNGLSTG
jgi:hypothetical protein